MKYAIMSDVHANPKALELSTDDLAWLRQLKHLHAKHGVAFSHGDFVCPEEWDYIVEGDDALHNFGARSEGLMFCGHTHHAQIWCMSAAGRLSSPFGRELEDPVAAPESRTFKLEKDARYIVNVGSVGYPRCDLCSSYAVYDTRARTVVLRRLPFDFKSYVEAMVARGLELPEWLVRLLLAAIGR